MGSTGLADCRIASKVVTKKAAAKKVAMARNETVDDARSDSTVATSSDKKAVVVRAVDRMSYEQWQEQEESRKAAKLGRLTLSEAFQRLETRNALCETNETSQIEDSESAADITCQQLQQQSAHRARKAKKG